MTDSSHCVLPSFPRSDVQPGELCPEVIVQICQVSHPHLSRVGEVPRVFAGPPRGADYLSEKVSQTRGYLKTAKEEFQGILQPGSSAVVTVASHKGPDVKEGLNLTRRFLVLSPKIRLWYPRDNCPLTGQTSEAVRTGPGSSVPF